MTTESIQARKKLGELIKKVRRQCIIGEKPLSQEALATCMGCTQSKIQKIEAGSVRVAAGTVEDIITHLHADPDTASRMRILVEYSAANEPWTNEGALVPRYLRRYMEEELLATEILSWHELRIPGPIQSEQYMLQQCRAEKRIDVTPFVRNRMRRKRVFHQPQLRCYQCVLAEEVLHRTASGLGRDTARDQIDHLLAINHPDDTTLADERTSVHLLSTDAAIPYLNNDFSLLHYADRQSLLYIEHVAGAQYLQKNTAIKQASTAWQHVTAAALDREATKKLLQKLRKEFVSG